MFAWLYSKIADPALRDLRAAVLDVSGMKAGDTVLDVCCGTGDQALRFAERGISAVGIDIHPGMIGVAERSRRTKDIRKASFQVADARCLPFRDGCFDCATVSLALHEKDRVAREEVFSEMQRAVRVDGVLVFVDFAVPLPWNAYGIAVRIVEFLAGWGHFRCSRDYQRQGGLDTILGRSGLQPEQTRYLKYGTMVLTKITGRR
jgi:ubiquinone/menaquinone biosynthesis C-methylase UbiE